MEITAELADWHAGKTLAVEANIEKLSALLQQKVELATLEQALTSADILVLLVDHKQFKAVDAQNIKQQWVIDTRGIWRG